MHIDGAPPSFFADSSRVLIQDIIDYNRFHVPLASTLGFPPTQGLGINISKASLGKQYRKVFPPSRAAYKSPYTEIKYTPPSIFSKAKKSASIASEQVKSHAKKGHIKGAQYAERAVARTGVTAKKLYADNKEILGDLAQGTLLGINAPDERDQLVRLARDPLFEREKHPFWRYGDYPPSDYPGPGYYYPRGPGFGPYYPSPYGYPPPGTGYPNYQGPPGGTQPKGSSKIIIRNKPTTKFHVPSKSTKRKTSPTSEIPKPSAPPLPVEIGLEEEIPPYTPREIKKNPTVGAVPQKAVEKKIHKPVRRSSPEEREIVSLAKNPEYKVSSTKVNLPEERKYENVEYTYGYNRGVVKRALKATKEGIPLSGPQHKHLKNYLRYSAKYPTDEFGLRGTKTKLSKDEKELAKLHSEIEKAEHFVHHVPRKTRERSKSFSEGSHKFTYPTMYHTPVHKKKKTTVHFLNKGYAPTQAEIEEKIHQRQHTYYDKQGRPVEAGPYALEEISLKDPEIAELATSRNPKKYPLRGFPFTSYNPFGTRKEYEAYKKYMKGKGLKKSATRSSARVKLAPVRVVIPESKYQGTYHVTKKGITKSKPKASTFGGSIMYQ